MEKMQYPNGREAWTNWLWTARCNKFNKHYKQNIKRYGDKGQSHHLKSLDIKNQAGEPLINKEKWGLKLQAQVQFINQVWEPYPRWNRNCQLILS